MDDWIKELSTVSAERETTGVPVYRRLLDEMSLMIADGRIPDHLRLPPDTLLAVQLGISHITLAKVLNALKQRGLVERSSRRGTFIRRPARTAAMENAKCNVVAVFLDTLDPRTMNTDFMNTMARELTASGFRPAFISAAESSQIQYTQILNIRQMPECCGAVIWSLMDEAQVNAVLAAFPAGFPLVFVAGDHRLDGGKRHDFVHYDGFSAGKETAAQFLASGGKRFLSVLCERHMFWRSLVLQQGISQALADAGLPPENAAIIRWDDAMKNLDQLLDRDENTLLLAVAPMEIKLLQKELAARGLPLSRLGNAVGFAPTGFSRAYEWDLPLYRFDTEELCRQAVNTFIRRLKEPGAEFQHILLPGKLLNNPNKQ